MSDYYKKVPLNVLVKLFCHGCLAKLTTAINNRTPVMPCEECQEKAKVYERQAKRS
jgi:hypothetical protein